MKDEALICHNNEGLLFVMIRTYDETKTSLIYVNDKIRNDVTRWMENGIPKWLGDKPEIIEYLPSNHMDFLYFVNEYLRKCFPHIKRFYGLKL